LLIKLNERELSLNSARIAAEEGDRTGGSSELGPEKTTNPQNMGKNEQKCSNEEESIEIRNIKGKEISAKFKKNTARPGRWDP